MQVLLPGSACLECSWGKGQYRQLHTETPCRPGAATDTPRTLAPAAAGAATAALMVAQSQKVLSESPPKESYEINGDLLAGRVTTSRRRRNANCRFPHAGRPGEVCLRKRFDVATVGDLLSVVPQSNSSQPLQLEFRRGILGANLFSDDRLATVEQLDSVRDNRLADMGLTARDRIVARHGDSPEAKVTHITMTADNHPQVSE